MVDGTPAAAAVVDGGTGWHCVEVLDAKHRAAVVDAVQSVLNKEAINALLTILETCGVPVDTTLSYMKRFMKATFLTRQDHWEMISKSYLAGQHNVVVTWAKMNNF